MSVFVDTSAILALLNSEDINHKQAQELWRTLIDDEVPMVSTVYVLSESFALVQSRLGIQAARAVHEIIRPYLFVEWGDENLYQEAASAVLVANRRSLSLFDCVSFVVLRRFGIITTFAFDNHFSEQGFVLLT